MSSSESDTNLLKRHSHRLWRLRRLVSIVLVFGLFISCDFLDCTLFDDVSHEITACKIIVSVIFFAIFFFRLLMDLDLRSFRVFLRLPVYREFCELLLFATICACATWLTVLGNRSSQSPIVQGIACLPFLFPASFRRCLFAVSSVVIHHIIVVAIFSWSDWKNVLFHALSVTILSSLILATVYKNEKQTKDELTRQQSFEYGSRHKIQMALDFVIQAEQESMAKSRMLSVISHELRSPCQAIVGMCSVLSSSKLSDEDRECVSIIARSADFLLSIINDFLNFSRLHSHQIVLKQEPTNIVEVVEDVLDLISTKAYLPDKQVEIFHEMDKNLPSLIISDGERLKQVLLNLASNAVKFCDFGHVCISTRVASEGEIAEWISMAVRTPHNVSVVPIKQTTLSILAPYLIFSVSDTGIGIEQNNLPRVFEEFFMVDHGPVKKFQGTGLGLAIVKKVVDLMQGSVRVKSEGRGKGTTFEVLLPLIRSPQIPQFVPEATPDFLSKQIFCISLIVNQNSKARKNLRQILEMKYQIPTFGFQDIIGVSNFLGLNSHSGFVPGVAPDGENQENTFFSFLSHLDEPMAEKISQSFLLSVLVVIDSNSVLSPQTSVDILRHCKTLEDSFTAGSFALPPLHFHFAFCSPMQDGNDYLSLMDLGYFAKLTKPIKQCGLVRLLNRVIESHDRRGSAFPYTPISSQEPLSWTAVDIPMIQVQPPSRGSSFRGKSPTPPSRSPSPGSALNPKKKKGTNYISSIPILKSKLPLVLIVDDNFVQQQVFSRMLKGHYLCECANDGHDAIEMLNQKHYFCILTDLNMNGFDGFGMTRAIRSRKDVKRNTPVVCISGEVGPEVQIEAAQAGVNKYLCKPVDKTELLSAIEQVTEDALYPLSTSSSPITENPPINFVSVV